MGAVHAPQRVHIDVPDWVDQLAPPFSSWEPHLESRMRLVIGLAARNVAQGGGPFAAALFSPDRLLVAGVNCVLSSGHSIAHAEILTIMRAQQLLAAAPGAVPPPYTLFTSTEPCCQCFGAIVWSGCQGLVCGAKTEDAEAIGFDEGPKPTDWVGALERRRIEVRLDVLRSEAKSVLDDYSRSGGVIYGMRHPTIG